MTTPTPHNHPFSYLSPDRLFFTAGPTSSGMFFRAIIDRAGVRLLVVTVPQMLSLGTLLKQVAPGTANLDGLDDVMSISRAAISYVTPGDGNSTGEQCRMQFTVKGHAMMQCQLQMRVASCIGPRESVGLGPTAGLLSPLLSRQSFQGSKTWTVQSCSQALGCHCKPVCLHWASKT